MIKHIITFKQSSAKGKSSTVKALASLFIETFPSFDILLEKGDIFASKDIRLIIEFIINGKKLIIAFDSKGDPGQKLDLRLLENINKYKCDIIFTACRSSGETFKQVVKIANENDYSLIFTAPYESMDSSLHNKLNILKAKHTLALLSDLHIL
jgi:hypothetical protein